MTKLCNDNVECLEAMLKVVKHAYGERGAPMPRPRRKEAPSLHLVEPTP